MKSFSSLKKNLLAATAIVGMVLVGSSAAVHAASATSPITKSFNVTMTVMPTCTFGGSTIPDLAFGTVGSLANEVDASTTFSLGCTVGTSYTMTLLGGLNSASTDTNRLLNLTGGGSTTIPYVLYSDSARTLPWGFQSSSTAVTSTGTGASQSWTIYGKVAANSSASLTPGNYLDTVVLNVAY